VDKFMKITCKYGIPYFANYINSDLSPEDAVSMCCRLRIDTTELRKRGGGLFGSNPLTGSIGVLQSTFQESVIFQNLKVNLRKDFGKSRI